MLACVGCGREATYVGRETQELLCFSCWSKKGYVHGEGKNFITIEDLKAAGGSPRKRK